MKVQLVRNPARNASRRRAFRTLSIAGIFLLSLIGVSPALTTAQAPTLVEDVVENGVLVLNATQPHQPLVEYLPGTSGLVNVVLLNAPTNAAGFTLRDPEGNIQFLDQISNELGVVEFWDIRGSQYMTQFINHVSYGEVVVGFFDLTGSDPLGNWTITYKPGKPVATPERIFWDSGLNYYSENSSMDVYEGNLTDPNATEDPLRASFGEQLEWNATNHQWQGNESLVLSFMWPLGVSLTGIDLPGASVYVGVDDSEGGGGVLGMVLSPFRLIGNWFSGFTKGSPTTVHASHSYSSSSSAKTSSGAGSGGNKYAQYSYEGRSTGGGASAPPPPQSQCSPPNWQHKATHYKWVNTHVIHSPNPGNAYKEGTWSSSVNKYAFGNGGSTQTISGQTLTTSNGATVGNYRLHTVSYYEDASNAGRANCVWKKVVINGYQGDGRDSWTLKGSSALTDSDDVQDFWTYSSVVGVNTKSLTLLHRYQFRNDGTTTGSSGQSCHFVAGVSQKIHGITVDVSFTLGNGASVGMGGTLSYESSQTQSNYFKYCFGQSRTFNWYWLGGDSRYARAFHTV